MQGFWGGRVKRGTLDLAVTWVFWRGLRVAATAATALRINQIRIMPHFGIGPRSDGGYEVTTNSIQRGRRGK
jgi:hypothetical protein